MTPDPRLHVLGCGTAAPSADRVGSGYLLRTTDVTALFDCGPGIVHRLAQQGAPAWQQLTHVVITHFHTDHIADLPALFFGLRHGMQPARRAPLSVVGPTGTRKLFARLANAFGHFLREPGFAVEITELGDDGRFDSAAISLHACRTPHTNNSLAYRVDVPGLRFGLTGDTGPSDAVGAFLSGVDELIAECSLPDAAAIPTHLSPSSLAALAQRAQPGRLIVTHCYPQLDREALPALLERAGWRGPVTVAFDGLAIR